MEKQPSFDELVGANVQRIRKAVGLSQAELADAISTDDERIPQQTIVKIEKGTRPLKYAEAVRISKSLKVGLAELAAVPPRAQHDAHYRAASSRLSQLQSELAMFAPRLAAELVDLTTQLSLDRSVLRQEDGPSPHLLQNAEAWIRQDWGEVLNDGLMHALRAHPDLTDLRDDLAAPTYIEVLTNAANRNWQKAADDALDT